MSFYKELTESDWLGRNTTTYIHDSGSYRADWQKSLKEGDAYSKYLVDLSNTKRMTGERKIAITAQLCRDVLATMTTKNNKLQLSFSKDSSYTDRFNYVVVSLKSFDKKYKYKTLNHNIDPVLGFCVHEAAHVIFTEEGVFNWLNKFPAAKRSFLNNIYQVLEDERIEQKVSYTFAGYAKYLEKCKQFAFVADYEEKKQTNEISELYEQFFFMLRFPTKTKEEVVDKYEKELRKIKDILTPYPETLNELTAATSDIYDVFFDKMNEDEQEEQEKEDDSGEGDGEDSDSSGEGSGSDDSSEDSQEGKGSGGEEGEDDKDNEEGEGEGEGKGKSDKNNDSGDKDDNNTDDSSGDGSDSSDDNSSDNSNSKQGGTESEKEEKLLEELKEILEQVGKQVGDKLDEAKKAAEKFADQNGISQPMIEKVVSGTERGDSSKNSDSNARKIKSIVDAGVLELKVVWEEIKTPKESAYDASYRDVAQYASALRSKLMQLNRNINVTHTNLSEGDFNQDDLVPAMLGSKNVYQETHSVFNRGCAVCTLIDESGSMGWGGNGRKTKFEMARDIAVMFERALDNLNNVDFFCYGHTTISSYGEEATLMRSYFDGRKKGNRRALGNITHSNTNRDGHAILEAVARVRQQIPLSTPIVLFVVSDGEPTAGTPSGFTPIEYNKHAVKVVQKTMNTVVAHLAVEETSGSYVGVYDISVDLTNNDNFIAEIGSILRDIIIKQQKPIMI